MNETEHLINRFLNGQTTVAEEHRLYKLLKNDQVHTEWHTLLPIIESTKTTASIDQWLNEDETTTYEKIVNKRRRKKVTYISAIAATVTLVLIMTFNFANKHTPRQFTQTDTIHIHHKTLPSHIASPKINNNAARTKTCIRKSSTTKYKHKVTVNKANTFVAQSIEDEHGDSLEFYLAKLENELERVSDSVYAIQLENMIRTDTRLQEIINRKLLEKLLEQDNYSASNYSDTTLKDR